MYNLNIFQISSHLVTLGLLSLACLSSAFSVVPSSSSGLSVETQYESEENRVVPAGEEGEVVLGVTTIVNGVRREEIKDILNSLDKVFKMFPSKWNYKANEYAKESICCY